MPSIDQLRYLVAVAKEKHFGKAARRCHVSQPSLSAQIQKLEDSLGIIVFDRSKKPILTTAAGAAIVEQAQVIIKEHARLKAIAQQGEKEPQGEFSLAIIPTLAPYLLPQFLAQFSQRYPKVKLSVQEQKTSDIVRNLLDDQLDGGLLVTPLGEERLIERHLFFEAFAVFTSRAHRLARSKRITGEQLSSQGLWILEEGHCFRSQVLKVCGRDRQGGALPNVAFESGNLETIKNLVKQSQGYTLFPQLAVDLLSPEEQTEHIRYFKSPIPTREVSLVYSRSFYKEMILNALESTIVASLPQSISSLKRNGIAVVDI